MKSVWQKVSHVNKNLLASAFKKNFYHHLFFAQLTCFSPHRTVKEFVACIKAAVHAFVISIAGVLFNADWLANF